MDPKGADASAWPLKADGLPARAGLAPRPNLARRLRALAGHELTLGIVGTLVLKVVGACLAFTMFSLAARAMGEVEFGHFVTWFSIASIAQTIAVFGQEMLILRNWNEFSTARRWGHARGALIFGASIASGLPTLIGLAVVAGEAAAGNVRLALALGLFILLGTAVMFSTHVTRTLVGIWQSDGVRELVWRVIVVGFLAMAVLRGWPVDGVTFFRTAIIGFVIVLLWQGFQIRRALPEEVRRATAVYDVRAWLPRSGRLWAAAVLEALSQYLEVIVVSFLLDPVAAGAYFVASRLANAFAMASDALYSFGTRRLPPLYYARDHARLDQTLRFMATIILLALVAGFAVVLAESDLLLGLFGTAYVGQHWTLVILCAGTASIAAAGPAGAMLMLSGNESRYTLLVAASVTLRALGLVLLAPVFGIMGAAMATSATLMLLAIALAFECRRLTGLDTSVFRLLRRSRPGVTGSAGEAR